jgi:hypothetical protein
VGTGSFVTPGAAGEVLDGLLEYAQLKGLARLDELVGKVIL